ncbi:uncharacterized protein [Temnothorax nylanderi]|uniref:uncharacterized protein n=1 Tax=Temnothorax nylanderi TaxID=102681 RepID=UPI003A859F29
MRPPSLVSSASLVSSSGASSDTEEKVPLGDGVFCSKAAYSKLINVEESHADWAYALLKGDKAHRMRVRISSKCSENEKFSQNFLMVAKFLHRDWLIKQTIRDNSGQLHSKYSPAEVENLSNNYRSSHHTTTRSQQSRHHCSSTNMSIIYSLSNNYCSSYHTTTQSHQSCHYSSTKT